MIKKQIDKPKKNVFSFANMKGGVGKSTLCANLAYCLAKHFNKKILLIDMDPQFNLSSLFIDEKELFENMDGKSDSENDITKIFDIKLSVTGKKHIISTKDIIKRKVMHDNIDIIPGSIQLFNIAEESSTSKLLNRAINDNGLKTEYDFIFIDCPPTKGKYLTISLTASDYYIIPVKPDFLSTIGIELFKTEVNTINEDSISPVKEFALIFTLVNTLTNHHSDKIKQIRKDYQFNTFTNMVKHSFKVPEYAEKKIFIYDFDKSNIREDYLINFRNDIINLAEEFLNKTKKL